MRFTIVGNGNVAWHFLHAFNRAGHICTEIIGRGAKPLGLQLPSWSQYKQITDGDFKETDICFVCVNDDQIEEIVQSLHYTQTMVVHCSGTMQLDLLSKFERRGIAWPVYSLSKNVPIDYSLMPICIETVDFLNYQAIEQFFSPITKSIHQVNQNQRKYLHLSAVFANNFTNHIYTIAAELCEKQNLSFDLLKPIINQTTEKAKFTHPSLVQTGPASRHDLHTISSHLDLLDTLPEYKTLYMLMTELIVEKYGIESNSPQKP
jgi:predicted short-subunit dehydrogenase-like oxidoreductase (DUF2520 family)